MSKDTLQKQADRADTIADQTVDDDMKRILRDAATEYRKDAQTEPMFALFRGETQLTGGFATEREVRQAARAQGLIPGIQGTDDDGKPLPAGYDIRKLDEPYEAQPDWKLPREIS